MGSCGATGERKGLGRDHGEGMTQTKIGDPKGATVQVDSDTDPESDGSDSEGKCQPRLNDGIAAQHARDLADMQVRAGRARAQAARRDQERRAGRRRRCQGDRQAGRERLRQARRLAAEGRYGVQEEARLRAGAKRARVEGSGSSGGGGVTGATNPNANSEEEEEEEEAAEEEAEAEEETEEEAEAGMRAGGSLSATLVGTGRRGGEPPTAPLGPPSPQALVDMISRFFP